MMRNLAGAPDAFGGGGHRHIGDAERGEGVEDRVHDTRGAGDGAAFADTLGAEWVCRARDGAENRPVSGSISNLADIAAIGKAGWSEENPPGPCTLTPSSDG
jgi:hypothetical protein